MDELIRRIDSKSSVLSGTYCSWADHACQYESTAILDASTRQFSKTAAIHNLYQALRKNAAAPEAKDMLKAFLTDQGLIFPQTRERGYPTGRSMRLHKNAEKEDDANEVDSILSFAKSAYDKRQASFEEEYPFITFERVQQGVHALIYGREGPFSIEMNNEEYPLGICKGDLSKISYNEDPAEVEHCMMQWIKTTQFCWGDGEYLFNDVMQKTLDFTTVELFEFLANILPRCFSAYDMWRKSIVDSHYCPSINTAQIDLLRKQIRQYQKEDLSQWVTALPALGQYLDPDLKQFESGCTSSEIDRDDSMLKALYFKLQNAFFAYFKRMEPASSKGGKTVYEKHKREVHHMAEWFLTATPDDSASEHLLFSECPHLIFHLFRSPVHRYIFNYEDRGWDLKRVIEDAYFRYPLPITNQSLQADEELFGRIVDVCAEMCESRNIVFHRETWEALWGCIAQSVQCLSFEEYDLFTARQGFTHIWHLRNMGAPVVDKWISKKLTSEAPNYISIWRRLINQYDMSTSGAGRWDQSRATFRKYFESSTTTVSSVYNYLSRMCNKINWTGIPFLPSPEELSKIDKGIHPRARNGHAAVIRNGVGVRKKLGADAKKKEIEYVNRSKERANTQFKHLWMEWLLVQCVCHQAQRELMESIWLYLKRSRHDTNMRGGE